MYVYSTPTLVLCFVTPIILEILLPQTLGYDEWIPLLQLLNEKRVSLAEFESLGMRALNIKKVVTPSVLRKRSRFDDIFNSLPEVGLLYSKMDTTDLVFWTEVLDSSISLK